MSFVQAVEEREGEKEGGAGEERAEEEAKEKERRREANDKFRQLLERGKGKRKEKPKPAAPPPEAMEEEAPRGGGLGFTPGGGQGLGAAPQGGLGLGAAPQGGLGLGAAPQGGLGLGAAPQGGLGLGAAPQGGLGLGAAPQGGLGLGAAPQGGLGLGAAPSGGLGLGAAPSGGLGLGAAPSGGLGLGAAPPSFQKATPQLNPAAAPSVPYVDPNLGKWEKHTKGIGMKLLSKMGFKGRLGAKEKGVSTVVETVVRPSNLGLGFGNFKEMAQLKNNKVFEAQLRGEDVVVDEPGAKAAQRKRRGPASLTDKLLKQQEQSWRKSEATAKAEKQRAAKADKAEKYVLSSSELVAKAGVGGGDLIVDMRGPDFNPDGADTAAPPAGPILPGAELMHNLTHLISDEEMKIQTATHYYNVARRKEEDMEKEERELGENVERTATREKALVKIRGALEQLGGDTGGKGGDDKIANVLTTFQGIQREHPDEWAALKLERLVPTYLSPSLSASLAGWNPFSSSPALAADTLKTYSSLCPPHTILDLFTTTVLPLIQAAASSPSTFSVVHHTLACVDLYESLKEQVGEDALLPFLQNTVLPRISQEVEHSWDPLDSPQPIHSWIFPWLPHLSLSHLFPTIRRKFHIALAKWSGPEDTSVRELIQPWKGVFDDKSFGAMVSRDILPRLSSSLRKFKTNVNLQDLAAFNSVAEWREHALITSAQFLALLEGDFFLPWLQALYDFCVGGGGKKELGEFYVGWKGVLVKAAGSNDELLEDDMTCVMLHAALCIIGRCADGGDMKDVAPPRAATLSFEGAVERRRKVAEEEEQRRRRDTGRGRGVGGGGAGEGEKLSFRDIVLAKAEEAGVEVVMKAGRKEGKQIWSWGGKHSIYFDLNVVFVNKAGEWEPVSVDELVQLAQAQ
ncbi:hypothetical protein TeGR_g4780 [Tetraparma gracilis]|uniref:G-patch domain-containing protein n=2 Tax=Tetraparma gracilis TaxID=2962635 RepID=A0ABQ6MWP2_9STRA|nr:hypothetical protein TeGR_g4780 [Tetraparma gracilis]